MASTVFDASDMFSRFSPFLTLPIFFDASVAILRFLRRDFPFLRRDLPFRDALRDALRTPVMMLRRSSRRFDLTLFHAPRRSRSASMIGVRLRRASALFGRCLGHVWVTSGPCSGNQRFRRTSNCFFLLKTINYVTPPHLMGPHKSSDIMKRH